MIEHLVARPTKATRPLFLLTPKELKSWLQKQRVGVKNWVKASDFRARPGELCAVPAGDGTLKAVLYGLRTQNSPWEYARLPKRLPKGRYQIAAELEPAVAEAAALGWALGTYAFTRYVADRSRYASLVWPAAADQGRVTRLVEAIGLGRDLINTPAGDLGPAELADAALELAKRHGAEARVIVGDKLLAQNYPAIHAVGRASTREPRLIDLRWGDPKAPKLTLVGKGVCFDTGGLDIKSAVGMKMMKKDMGGAAMVLSMAHVLMGGGLPVRLRVLIPAVENSISGNAFRPLDVLATRKGVSVEVGNTDAEGRLILCDALAEADSEDPDLLIDVATLTGAARIALGTDLPAVFISDDPFADDVQAASRDTGDPLWRMPLHTPYRKQLDSSVADLNNVGGSYGGAITAALFLKEFISPGRRWLHMDTMGYNLETRPGRPRGGEVLGLRALTETLFRRYQ